MTALVVLCVAAVVGLRHRRWQATLSLLACLVLLTGAESLTLGGSAGAGSYQQACGPVHRFGGGSVSATYRKAWDAEVEVVAQVAAYGAVDNAHTEEGERIQSPTLAGRAMGGVDHRWFGAHLGLNGGQMWFAGDALPQVMPAATLRLGPRSAVFFDGGFGDDFNGSSPVSWVRVGIGVGLPPIPRGAWNHSTIGIGVTDVGAYLKGSFEVTSGTRLRIVTAFAGRNELRAAVGFESRFELGRKR